MYEPSESNELLKAEAVTGKCYVLTFSPAHNLTLADMTPSEIVPVIKAWTQIYSAHISSTSPLAKLAPPTTIPPMDHIHLTRPNCQYRYMQIFENKGAAMGCSNPHPHGQIWTVTGLPEEPGMELVQLQKYRAEHEGKHMLEDYAILEAEKNERLIFQNDNFLALCPWWAVWPFEVMIVSRRHQRALLDFDEAAQNDLAEAIAEVTRRYDNLFETHFPYSMGIHQAPLEGTDEEIEASHFHIHFYPPLLRSATVRKFLVGCVRLPLSLSSLLETPLILPGMSFCQSLSATLHLNKLRQGCGNAVDRYIESICSKTHFNAISEPLCICGSNPTHLVLRAPRF